MEDGSIVGSRLHDAHDQLGLQATGLPSLGQWPKEERATSGAVSHRTDDQGAATDSRGSSGRAARRR